MAGLSYKVVIGIAVVVVLAIACIVVSLKLSKTKAQIRASVVSIVVMVVLVIAFLALCIGLAQNQLAPIFAILVLLAPTLSYVLVNRRATEAAINQVAAKSSDSEAAKPTPARRKKEPAVQIPRGSGKPQFTPAGESANGPASKPAAPAVSVAPAAKPQRPAAVPISQRVEVEEETFDIDDMVVPPAPQPVVPSQPAPAPEPSVEVVAEGAPVSEPEPEPQVTEAVETVPAAEPQVESKVEPELEVEEIEEPAIEEFATREIPVQEVLEAITGKPATSEEAEEEPEAATAASFNAEDYFDRATTLRDQGLFAVAVPLYAECFAKATELSTKQKARMEEMICLVKSGNDERAQEAAAWLSENNEGLSPMDKVKISAVLKRA